MIQHVLRLIQGDPLQGDVLVRIHRARILKRHGRNGLIQMQQLAADAGRGVNGTEVAQRVAAETGFLLQLASCAAIRRFAAFQLAGRNFQQCSSCAMAVLPDQQDMLIAHQQDGRSAGMADEIALRADTMIQQHLIAV